LNLYQKICDLLTQILLVEKSAASKAEDYRLKKKFGLLKKRKGDFGEKEGWVHEPGVHGEPGTGTYGEQAYKFNTQTYKKEMLVGKHSIGGKKRGKPRGPLKGTIGRGTDNRNQQSATDKLQNKLDSTGKINLKNPNWNKIVNKRQKPDSPWRSYRDDM